MPDDKKLGMSRNIPRRDFVNGVATLALGLSVSGGGISGNEALQRKLRPMDYPPAKTGLRGSHPGSFEVAHQLAREGRRDWGPEYSAETEPFDLVVVGAGISGLAAAYFYQQNNPDARILVLDNHDDFGGHARRNEFQLRDRTYLSYGGSQSLEDPQWYSSVTKQLLRDLGVDVTRFYALYDQQFFRRHGLQGAVYFDQQTFGKDQLVRYPLQEYDNFLPLTKPDLSVEHAVKLMPLSKPAREQMLKLLTTKGNRLVDIPAEEQADYLWRISYREFLARHLGVDHPEVLSVLNGLTNDSTISIDRANALGILTYVGLPGLKATAIDDYNDDKQEYIFHFPDGNASIARLLVQKLIPAVSPASGMDEIVSANFDYQQLDVPGASVKLRLHSTVINVQEADHSRQNLARIQYVMHGKAYTVEARHCVLAGYNAMIPSMCPQLDQQQRQGLAWAVKSPILYTNVLLNNWRAFKKLGIGQFSSPGSYYSVAFLDFPVSMPGLPFSSGPDEPIVLHLERFYKGPAPGATREQQHRLGRHELFNESFESIERKTREQLAGALAEGGFDPARDIAGITLNRWGHGYANWYSPMDDGELDDAQMPYKIGRRQFGNVSVANSDAGGSATVDAAIDQAHRAVSELLG